MLNKSRPFHISLCTSLKSNLIQGAFVIEHYQILDCCFSIFMIIFYYYKIIRFCFDLSWKVDWVLVLCVFVLRSMLGNIEFNFNLDSTVLVRQFWFYNFDFKILSLRFWFYNLGSAILALRSWFCDLGFEILVLRSWVWDLGFEILVLRSWFCDLGLEILVLRPWFWDLGSEIWVLRPWF